MPFFFLPVMCWWSESFELTGDAFYAAAEPTCIHSKNRSSVRGGLNPCEEKEIVVPPSRHCVMSGKGGKDSHVYDMQPFTSAEDSRQLYDCRGGCVSVKNTFH